jgi:hypothetical protein
MVKIIELTVDRPQMLTADSAEKAFCDLIRQKTRRFGEIGASAVDQDYSP